MFSQYLPKQEALTKRAAKWQHWNLWLQYALSEWKHPKRWAQGRASAMVVTAHSVIYMMATTVACKQLKDFLCLARKYKKRLLGDLENGLGDVREASKTAFGGGFGRGYPSRSILDQFWTRLGEWLWALNRAQMGPEVEFKEAHASKIASARIWSRFDIDFKAILGGLRGLS